MSTESKQHLLDCIDKFHRRKTYEETLLATAFKKLHEQPEWGKRAPNNFFIDKFTPNGSRIHNLTSTLLLQGEKMRARAKWRKVSRHNRLAAIQHHLW